MNIRRMIAEELESAKATPETMALWEEITVTFEDSGPDGVKDLISNRVKGARKRAAREAREMTEVAGAVAKPKKKRRK